MSRTKPGRGPKISDAVRRLIISQAIHDSKTMPRRALAVRLQDLIEKMGEISPTEDTLARLISEARNKQPSELDQPWHIGTCFQYNITPDAIPEIIQLMKERASCEEGSLGQATIREARWINSLYPAINRLKLGDDDLKASFWMSVIVSGYVLRERVSEQMNEQYPNTSDLDRLYFANEDPFSDTAMVAWWNRIPHEYQQAVVDAVEQERAATHEEMTLHKGRPLTREETKMINDCFNILKKGGPDALSEYIKSNPLAQENSMVHIMSAILYSKAMGEPQ